MWKKIVAAAAAAVGIASVSATPTDAQDLSSLAQSPKVTKCSDEFLIDIPGGGNTVPFLPETAPIGGKETEVSTGVYRASHGRIQPVWISYMSIPFTFMSYNDSSRDGYRVASDTMRRLADMCPNATFSITGYSEGADIGAQLVNAIGHGRGPVPANRVNSAVFISNPHLADNGGSFSGGATAANQGALERLDGGYGELGPRVLDICRSDDPICAFPDEWRVHVDPFLRVAMFRGQVPVTELLTIIAKRSPTTLPLIFSMVNHVNYGGANLAEGPAWILSRQAPIRQAN
ncbi:cutinase family protein [Corynebacterium sp. P3-F1]|uniref:cutinase family protein n=1 Tax=Corynebacterium sp. P3-F1 TaxID=3059080 RepID=UPI00265CE89B|nr:cutinase family protein [Corynebacterium sp. P3-F1]WKK61442.1 cutinase family protein [Corynebacterium sp. P3-F1]